MSRFQRSVLLPLLLALATAVLLIIAWELWAESLTFRLLGIPYHPDLEVMERWHFVLVASGAVVLSLIIPAVLLRKSALRLEETYIKLNSERKHAQELARHDALTGLPNRRVFGEALTGSIETAAESPAAALLIDLDRFKPVNDIYGHQAGDVVLCEVARRLLSLRPPGGLVARLGGDEFAIMAPFGTHADMMRLAKRIIRSLNDAYASLPSDLRVGARSESRSAGRTAPRPRTCSALPTLPFTALSATGRTAFDSSSQKWKRKSAHGHVSNPIFGKRLKPARSCPFTSQFLI